MVGYREVSHKALCRQQVLKLTQLNHAHLDGLLLRPLTE